MTFGKRCDVEGCDKAVCFDNAPELLCYGHYMQRLGYFKPDGTRDYATNKAQDIAYCQVKKEENNQQIPLTF
jgi:hypothetical protein